jgi:hypothetical protein
MVLSYGNRGIPPPGTPRSKVPPAPKQRDLVELATVGATIVWCGVYIGCVHVMLATTSPIWCAATAGVAMFGFIVPEATTLALTGRALSWP